MSFYNTIKDDINIILKQDLLKKNYKKEIYDMFQVSDPPKDKFGDVSTNVALSLSKFLKTNPENFADILIKELKKIDYIEDIKVEGHGFINLLLKKDFWINELKQVLLKEDKYGENNIGKSKKEIFFSSYLCHPSMANNEVSGIVTSLAISKYIKYLKKTGKFSENGEKSTFPMKNHMIFH